MSLRDTIPAVAELPRLQMPPCTNEVLANGVGLHYFVGGDQAVCYLTIVFPGGVAETGDVVLTRMRPALLLDGSARFGTADMADIMDFNGVKPSYSANAHCTTLSFSMLTKRLGAMLPVIADMIAQPLFPNERLETMKLGAKAQYATSRREITTLADEAFDPMVMGAGHPLSIPASEAQIDAITQRSLANLHARSTSPRDMHIFLAGQLSDADIEAVRNFALAIPTLGAGIDRMVRPYEMAPAGTCIKVEHKDTLQSAVQLALPAVARSHPDYNSLRLSVMALGGYFGSRLMKEVREEQGLTYGIGAHLLGSQEGAYIKIAARCDKSYTERVLGAIATELVAMQSRPPAGEELLRLKRHARTALAKQLDTPASIISYYATAHYIGIEGDYFAAQQEAIDALTPERITALASSYLSPDKLRTVIAG